MPRIMLIILIANVLVTLGSAGTHYWLLKSAYPAVATAPLDGTEMNATAAPTVASDYRFVPVNKIIVSVRDAEREHYLVLDLVLQAGLGTELLHLERLDPMVRNSAVAYLSAKPFAELRGLPVGELQKGLEQALRQDLAARNMAVPFGQLLVSKLLVQ